MSDFGSARRANSDIQIGDRLEGTEDYLAPELVKGTGKLSFASDLWALGVTIYQMLAGKTPMWAGETEKASVEDERKLNLSKRKEKFENRQFLAPDHEKAQKEKILAKIVQFEGNQDIFTNNFDPLARDLIENLLKSDPSERLGVEMRGERQIVNYDKIRCHPFFVGLEWDHLHTLPAPQFSVGSVAPAPDAKWARRKNSIMWAPMPKTFQFADANWVMDMIEEEEEQEIGIRQANKEKISYTGFQPKLPGISMAEEDEQEEEEDEDEDEDDRLFLSERDLHVRQEQEEYSTTPMRYSSRVVSHCPESDNQSQTALPPPSSRAHSVLSAAAAGPSAAPSLSSSLPPRPRIPMTLNSSSGQSQQTPTAAPWAKPPVARAPLGNPTASSLLARVLGEQAKYKGGS